MAITVNIDSITLDILSSRLKNIVSPIDILKWLNNFQEDEQKHALVLLQNLTVYTSNEIEEIFHNGITQILTSTEKKEKLIINPIGEFGKSGSMMAYLVQKTNAFRKGKNKIILTNNIESIDKKNSNQTLLLIDDFVGSGETIEKDFLKKIKPHASLFKHISFMGAAGIDQGISKIKPLFKDIYIPKTNIFKKAFSSDASYFGYRKHSEYRELAYKYGARLTGSRELKSGKLKFENALGYGNSQGLVAFFYGCPNNSLPIFWQGDFKKQKWYPLIPRFNQHKIEQARSFRKKISFELSLFKEFGSLNLRDTFVTYKVKKGKKQFSSINHLDFSLYAILKMKRRRMSEFLICQRLGISYKDYELYLVEGIKKGIFDENKSLTMFGLELYHDAKEIINKNLKYQEKQEKNMNVKKNILFIPKTFNGKS